MKTQLISDDLEVGERLFISTLSGHPIGRGTYVWDGNILLDIGQTIQQKKCRWEPAPADQVPPFKVKLTEPVRGFYWERGNLYNHHLVIDQDQTITIGAVDTVGWNHGIYLGGKVRQRGRAMWVLISELPLPEIKAPHLRLVVG